MHVCQSSFHGKSIIGFGNHIEIHHLLRGEHETITQVIACSGFIKNT